MNMSRFKILALVGMVDIIVCRPQEMKREKLVNDIRISVRKENRNQEIIEDRSITKFSQGGKTEEKRKRKKKLP